jgi:hypothetical protein
MMEGRRASAVITSSHFDGVTENNSNSLCSSVHTTLHADGIRAAKIGEKGHHSKRFSENISAFTHSGHHPPHEYNAAQFQSSVG